jgi:hypothetical protein
MDVMFDGLEMTLPCWSDPITMGVTSGYDFFGGHAVYVEGFAQDGYCTNTMRQLTDKEVIKNVGDVKDFRSWWEDILTQIGLVADDLVEFIRTNQYIGLGDFPSNETTLKPLLFGTAHQTIHLDFSRVQHIRRPATP